MEFGKVPHPERVDFSLPPEHPQTDGVLPGKTGKSINLQETLFTGCPVWRNKNWRGLLFPERTPEAQFLRHYSKQFNCIELNATHYQTPRPEVVRSWRDQTPEGFQFCPKLPQSLSHHKRLKDARDEMLFFAESMWSFESRLGLCFLQLPPDFAPEREADTLCRFLEDWPKEIPLAVEFRHAAWFQEGQAAEETFAHMQAQGVGTVITDVAGRRDVAHLRLTAPFVALRFVGNVHPTDNPRLEQWAEIFAEWLARGIEKAYFWSHQPDNTEAPQTADQFLSLLQKHGLQPKRPRFMPRQGGLF